MGGGGVGIAGRLGINFGSGTRPSGAGNPVPGLVGGDSSDHWTLIALVVAEMLAVGWLRLSFKRHFGG